MKHILQRLTARVLAWRHAATVQPVHKPSSLKLALAIIGRIFLLAMCTLGMLTLAALGHPWWTIAAVSAVLVCLVRRRRPVLAFGRPGSWLRHVHGFAGKLCAGLLVCWLGLIVWSQAAPGGPAPAPKESPRLVRVLTWNIHVGHDGGPFWERFDWPTRQHALQTAVLQADPDILCVQEAVQEQVAFLERALPDYGRVGVGRDDGRSGGEHCAIFFRRARFQEIGKGTFWLEEPINQPRPGSALGVKRICSWVRLQDRQTGGVLRVYNTHLYLTEARRRQAVPVILEQIRAGDLSDTVVFTADFNTGPSTASRQMLSAVGLTDSAVLAGKPAGTATFQLYGIGLRSLDGILLSPGCRVDTHRIVNVKPGNVFPSDHFGVLADLESPRSR
jgi:endonuclease/exonuclease/phosphatase family metal-dependent hydrolase